MSKENKNKCKYCHLSGHVIDKCPTIICKHCKAIGHPNWLCKSNPNAENVKSPLSPNLRNKKSIYAFDSTNSLSKSQSQNFDVTNVDVTNVDVTNVDVLNVDVLNVDVTNIKKDESINENKKINSYKNFFKEDIKKSDIKNVYVGFKEDFKEKNNETNEVKKEKIINLQYYQKIIDSKWGDLIEII